MKITNSNQYSAKFLKLKWYYDENPIIPIKAILKHGQVDCMRRKNAVYCFQISLFVPAIFKFLKPMILTLANWWRHVHVLIKFWSNMVKKDISANLYQYCLILCSKILPKVLQSTSLKVLFPWQHTEFQTSPILKAFLATLSQSSIFIFENGASYAWSSRHINMLEFVAPLSIFRAESH